MSDTTELKWGIDGRSGAQLTLADLNPSEKLHRVKGIAPESLAKVSAEFVLQLGPHARYVIKELDTVLRPGGAFEVTLVNSREHSGCFLSRDQVKYEFSVATDGRYRMVSQTIDQDLVRLAYVKTAPALSDGDLITRWSFGIITNGRKLELVDELCRSIFRQHIPEYEVIVCGPYDPARIAAPRNVRVLPDVALDGDCRFPTPAKKNRIVDAAQFGNICIFHDRFLLPEGWFDRMKAYGNYFDYLCLPTVDSSGNRFVVDWMTFASPLTSLRQRNGPLPYGKWSPDVIVQGGIILGKTRLLRRHRLDERLHWEELEDMHFSKVAYLDGAFIAADPRNYVVSHAVNHRPKARASFLRAIAEWLYWYAALWRNRRRFRAVVRRQAARTWRTGDV